MPRIEDQPQVQAQEQAKANVQQEAVKQGTQALSQYLGELMKGLLNDLGGKPGIDNQAMDAAKQQVDARLDALDKAVDALGRTEPSQEDTKLAEDLGDALKDQADLDEVRQEIDRAADQNREALERPIDPLASDEQIAQQVVDRDAARERQPWLDQASEAARVAETARSVSDEVRAIRDDLAKTGAVNEAARQLAQVTDQLAAENAKDLEAIMARIKQEAGIDWDVDNDW